MLSEEIVTQHKLNINNNSNLTIENFYMNNTILINETVSSHSLSMNKSIEIDNDYGNCIKHFQKYNNIIIFQIR